MRIFVTIHPCHLTDVTGGAKRVSVRKDNTEIVSAMTRLKGDIEALGKAQIEKGSSSSQMLPMMMMMMQRR
ncbi:MAG: hypothetical protein ACKV2T_36980 [Kofleriaceae bacterium]